MYNIITLAVSIMLLFTIKSKLKPSTCVEGNQNFQQHMAICLALALLAITLTPNGELFVDFIVRIASTVVGGLILRQV